MTLEGRVQKLERQEGRAGDDPYILIICRRGDAEPTDAEVDAEVKRQGGRVCVLVWDGQAREFA